ncbi:hypothetical protein [Glutamicibacter sp. ZJUTW]|uniref:hypothetical protein n=1 Tax=Glutamicibacter sp. ZJUTW TaxID=1155384 RepID=UPI0011F17F2C|nr:hypothetical protein [Glutamicibacter sp. ZJUTW]QEP08768.1 hypothetical protein F0M17_16785 [Glutamicibacter sp. ZJUTW]
MNELHPLGKLIQAAQDREGWSTRDLERAAERKGHSMKHSNFSRLKIEPVIAIKASQIQVLASVLGVSEQAVAMAAIESMGVQLDSTSASLEDSLRNTTDLSNRDQRLILSLAAAMRDTGSGSIGQDDSPRPDNDTPPRLRAVAPTSNTRPGQKTETDYGITELHGDEARNISVPPREQLAAHPKVKTRREQLDEETSEHHVENQDPGYDL